MEPTKSKSLLILLSLMLLIAMLMGGYSWNQSNTFQKNNVKLQGEVANLNNIREDLMEDIEELQGDYDALVAADEILKADLEVANKDIEKKQAELKKLQKKYSKDVGWMKAEIKNLRAAKKELTALVAELKKQNTDSNATDGALLDSRLNDIETRNKELEAALSEAKRRNAALEAGTKDLDIAAIQASNMRVDLFKNGKKPTGSYRRTKEIVVSFDVKNLPDRKKGVHNLYTVIKHATGEPVKVANPIKATIRPFDGGPVEEIIAQQMLTSDLFENVRLQFKINPERKTLKKGYYWVYVYADWGLLGRTEFQLR